MHEINIDIVKINSFKIRKQSHTNAASSRDAYTEILFSEMSLNSEVYKALGPHTEDEEKTKYLEIAPSVSAQ